MTITCIYAENCNGVEIGEQCMPMKVGDAFELEDNTTFKLPIGKAEFELPDHSVLRLTGPATIILSEKDLQGSWAVRWKLILGKIWSVLSDRPIHEPEHQEHAVAGVRG